MNARKKISCHFVAAVAAAFAAGCAQPRQAPQAAQTHAPNQQWQLCVDSKGNVVPEENCDRQDRSGVHAGGIYPYYWFFARGSSPVPVGGNVQGLQGSPTPIAGSTVLRASQYRPPSLGSTQRGIFGGTSRSPVS